MIYLNVPVSGGHGWGVCGKSIAREMARIEPVMLLTDAFALSSVGDEIEFTALQALLPSPQAAAKLASAGGTLDGPLLQTANKQLEPIRPLRGKRTIGYTFFEDTQLVPAYLENVRHFDRIVAGSTWCAGVLRDLGLKDVPVVIQGVDPEVFFPREPSRRFFADRFVVYSGGKFEFRKGQDIVIRAFKALQDRHRDVMLVVSWQNPWTFSFQTMRQSPHIRFAPRLDTSQDAAVQILADNGIDSRRILSLPLREHSRMADVYRNTDIGLFPNRAEGGTNLVLMEYMACGKPVIATAETGHADVVTPDNALIIQCPGQVQSSSDGASTAIWPEPSLDDAVDKLEWAYQNRDAIRAIGERAGSSLAPHSWHNAARQFHALLTAG